MIITLSACSTPGSKPREDASAGAVAPQLDTDSTGADQASPESNTLAAGTDIPVELSEMIDSTSPVGSGFIVGKVADSVLGSDGKLAIAPGSTALVLRRSTDRPGDTSVMVLTLYSVTRKGHQFRVDSSAADTTRAVIRADDPSGPRLPSVHLTAGSRVSFKLPAAWQLR